MEMSMRIAYTGIATGFAVLAGSVYYLYKNGVFWNNSENTICHKTMIHNHGMPTAFIDGDGDGNYRHWSGICSDNGRGYTPKIYISLPVVVIEYIKNQGWSILEMCAGTAHNKRKLEEAGIEVVAYDMFPEDEDEIHFATTGSVEHMYPQSALMILAGLESYKSIEAYTGDHVILGGYLDMIVGKPKTVYIIDDVSDMGTIKQYVSIDTTRPGHSDGKKDVYKIDIHPTIDYMMDKGWKIKQVFYAASGDATYLVGGRRVFIVWERIKDVTTYE